MSIITNNPKEKTAAALGAFMFPIPYFMDTKTEFVTFYMKQNFGLFIITLILKIIATIVYKMVPLTALNTVMFIFGTLNIIIGIIALFLIYKAYKGEKFELPYVLEYTNKLIEKVKGLQPLFAPKK